MQELREAITVLQARMEGRQIECQSVNKKDADWARITATHPFNFAEFRYRIVVFPEITFGLFSLASSSMDAHTFTNPASAMERLGQLNKDPEDRWVLVRVTECGQADESKPRATSEPVAST